jgi:hypothetical protein
LPSSQSAGEFAKHWPLLRHEFSPQMPNVSQVGTEEVLHLGC